VQETQKKEESLNETLERRKKMKRILFASVVFLASVLVITSNLQAQKVIEWRIHSPHSEARDMFIMQKEWADTLTKESNGRLKVRIYPSGALGFKDADMLRVVGGSVIEGSLFYPGYITRDDPILGLTCPEMIVYQREHLVAYYPHALEAMKKRLAKKWKIRLSVAFPSPTSATAIVGKFAFDTLESLQGKKIRAWEIQQIETLSKLGIPGQVMPQADLYLALKSGVLDGAIYSVSSYNTGSIYEVAPYWSILYESSVILGMQVSEKVFKSLPTDLQEMMEKVESKLIKKWSSEANKWPDKYDQAAFSELEKKKAQRLKEFSLEDKELVIRTGIEVWRERAKKLGKEAEEYQKGLEKKLMLLKLKKK